MANNQFKTFAAGGGANVMTQAEWEAAAAILANGFTAGILPSAELNKKLRQDSVPVAMLAQLISDVLNQDVLDNGDTTSFERQLQRMLLSVPVAVDVGLSANTIVLNPTCNIVDFTSSKFYIYALINNTNTSQTVSAVINGSSPIPVRNLDGQLPDIRDLVKGRYYGLLFDPVGLAGGPVLKIQSGLQPIRLTANATIFVNAGTGNDNTADGTAGLPFQTLQAARNFAVQHFNGAGLYGVTFNCSGAFTSGVNCSQAIPGVMAYNESWLFQAGSSIITTANSDVPFLVTGAFISIGGTVTLSTVTVAGSAADSLGISGNAGVSLSADGINFGACSRHQIEIDFGGFLALNANYTISGAPGVGGIVAGCCHMSIDGGTFQGWAGAGSKTITITGTPAWPGSMIQVINQGIWKVGAGTTAFSGAATGKRYAVGVQSMIATGGQGPNYFPGNVAGTVDTTNFGVYT